MNPSSQFCKGSHRHIASILAIQGWMQDFPGGGEGLTICVAMARGGGGGGAGGAPMQSPTL